MILDRVEHIEEYAGLSPRLDMAMRILSDRSLDGSDPGRYELRGDEIYAIVQRYQTKPPEQGIWEAHRKYIDIQYVAEGIERIGWADVARLKLRTPYDEQTDVAFYDGEGLHLTVPKGHFAIFFPHDAHAPGLAMDHPAPVYKVVIKIAVG